MFSDFQSQMQIVTERRFLSSISIEYRNILNSVHLSVFVLSYLIVGVSLPQSINRLSMRYAHNKQGSKYVIFICEVVSSIADLQVRVMHTNQLF